MPIATRLTERLGIAHPVLSAPMDVISGGRLAAAVTRAGGLGFLGGGYADDADWFAREFAATGNEAVGCGFITWSLRQRPELLCSVLARNPKAIFLSFDDPEDEETPPKVLEFLKKHEATFENYLSGMDLNQGGAEAFHIDGGSLPHYKLYDRSGKLLQTFSTSDPDQEFSHEILAAAVEAALK